MSQGRGKRGAEELGHAGPWMARREFVRDAALAIGGIAVLPSFSPAAAGEIEPDTVTSEVRSGRFSLENRQVSADWELDGRGLRLTALRDKRSGDLLRVSGPAFRLEVVNGTDSESSSLRVVRLPQSEDLKALAAAARFAERLPGKLIAVEFATPDGNLAIQWRAMLREGSHYIRQELAIHAPGREVPLQKIFLVDAALASARVAGSVDGSPLVAGSWFLGFEHPLSQSRVENGRAQSLLVRRLPLAAGHRAVYSSVIGTTPPGELRRGFLRYLERERAHPYRPFLHYNSWYDLGYFTPFDEAAALDAIQAFGRQLRVQRGVTLDSFLFDDGWDDHQIWGFNSGFPRGFAPLREAAAAYGAAPGVWLSPWGGYSRPKQERLAYGREHGFEQNSDGLALSGPIYFRRFREVCLEMIRKYGVNQFKFDGTGNDARVIPGSEFGSDFEAALRLIADLRAEKPDLFVNVTTGTYPSPFWLMLADSTWRGGEDHEFAGVGTPRQQWITYRDADTFASVVKRGPLYPLNSLMLHGLIFARHAKKLDSDPGGDFRDEVRSYFATGTQLQEMYLTHSLLSPANWDALAEAARWSRENASVLVDTHWIGGDPGALEVYGWASWSPEKGLITLRNPKDRAQTFELDVRSAFELPGPGSGPFSARSPWKSAATLKPLRLEVGQPHPFKLEPFEVLTLELAPHSNV